MKMDMRRYLALLVAAAFAAPAFAAEDEYFEPSSLGASAGYASEVGAQPVSYNEMTFLGESAPACTTEPAPSCTEQVYCRPLTTCFTTEPITNPYQGFNFSLDSTILKPHLGAISTPFLPGGLITPTYDFAYAPRINLGYEGEYGLGVKASYWSLAQESNGDTGAVGGIVTARTQAETIDIDITQRIVFQKWNFLVGTGIRSVNTQNTLRLTGLGSIADNFDGWGPNLLIEANRPIADSRLSLYANGKASLLFGQTAFDLTTGGGGGQVLVSNDTVSQIYQIGLGLQWKGDVLFTKVGLEGQIWNQGQVAGLIGLDYGYVGPTTTIGINF